MCEYPGPCTTIVPLRRRPNGLRQEGAAFAEEEYARWLAEARFQGFARSVLSAGNSLITAHKPA